jgi:DNA polymerase-3 subunit gamma/tau
MTFYLKYRPKTLDELDIESVRESLKKIVSSKNIPHAFLLTGPKGIGKTSVARILAAIVNCENIKKSLNPCGKCGQCKTIARGTNIDVLELDAASHRGIDDARLLRDAVKLSPANARKKVYIIDEAHMLTVEASNALLKTLEEPPDHVIFILATTNPEKLIDTIKSRTSIINFRKATDQEIIRSLEKIIKAEKIKIDDKSLSLIAKYSEGSFRDAHKILEQITIDKIKNYEDIEVFLSSSLSLNVNNLLNFILEKQLESALKEVDRLVNKGTNVEYINQKLTEKLKESLLAKVGIGENDFTQISKDENVILLELLMKANRQLKDAYIEELPLEIALIKWCQQKGGIKKETWSNENIEKKEIENSNALKQVRRKPLAEGKKVTSNLKEISEEIWSRILSQIKPINMSVEALLRAAKPVKFDGKTLTLGVYYRFHKERLEDIRNRQILERVIEQVLSIPTKVVCILTEAPTKKTITEDKSEIVLSESGEEDVVKAAKDIFGN